jgi:hypothetical protein
MDECCYNLFLSLFDVCERNNLRFLSRVKGKHAQEGLSGYFIYTKNLSIVHPIIMKSTCFSSSLISCWHNPNHLVPETPS